MRSIFRIFAAALLGFYALTGLSQAAPATGFDPYSTFHSAEIDNVNLKNGNSVINIPLFSFPQRGAFKPITFGIRANTSIWTATFPPGCVSPCFYQVQLVDWTGFPAISNDVPFDGLSGGFTSTTDSGGGLTSTLQVSANDVFGTQHPLVFNQYDLTELRSVDGSGYRAKYPTGSTPYDPFSTGYTPVIYQRNGVHSFVSGSNLGVVDLDGNQIFHTIASPGFTDSIGRTYNDESEMNTNSTAVAETCPSIGSDPSDTQPTIGFRTWDVVNTYGTTTADPRYHLIICYAKIHIHTDFWGNGGANYYTTHWDEDEVLDYTYYNEYDGVAYVIQSVILPDGTHWGFHYESAPVDSSDTGYSTTIATGVVNKIIEPGGGTISYTYTRTGYTIQHDSSLFDTIYIPLIDSRTQDSSTSSTTGVNGTWNYTIYPPGGNYVYTASATVTDPPITGSTGNVTTYAFDRDGETTRDSYDDSSNLLKHTATYYSEAVLPQPAWSYSPYDVSAFLSSKTTALNGTTVGSDGEDYGGTYYGALPESYRLGSSTTNFIATTATLTLGQKQDSWVHDGSGGVLSITSTTYVTDDATLGPSYLPANLLDLPLTTTESDGSVSKTTTYTYNDSGNLLVSGLGLGHVTSISPASGIVSHKSWTTHGAPANSIDPKGYTTTYNYGSGSTYLHPDSITYANTSIVDAYTYDATSGTVLTHTDPNGNTTTYSYDGAGRPWKVLNPDTASGGSQVACYPDANTVKVYQSQAAAAAAGLSSTLATSGLADGSACPSASTAILSTAKFDGLARKIATILRAPEGDIETDTTYDKMGHVSSVTNPYIGSPTGYSISTSYDALDRPLTVTEQDGSTRTMSYSGLDTTATDEALNKTKRTTDFLGRTTDVYEPTANNSTSSMLHTQYSYYLHGLWKAEQNGNGSETHRVRRFDYDSIGRLTSVCNPEGLNASYSCDGSHWSMTYAYTASSALCSGDLSLPCSKTDANSVQTDYYYDSMNRVYAQYYSNDSTFVRGLHATYDSYGAWGSFTTTNQAGHPAFLLTGVTLSGGTGPRTTGDVFSYDSMGRVNIREEVFPSEYSTAIHATEFAYDIAGHLTDIWYPPDATPGSGKHVQQTYDSAGRLTKVYTGSGASEIDYLSSATFYPNGSPATYTYGNGVTESFSQNYRLQTTAITAANAASFPLMDRTYSYSPSDAIGGSPACSATSGAHNTGTIWKITDNLSSAWTKQFQYDCLDRLTQANVGSNALQYQMDSFGNMSPKVSGSPVLTFAANNRISNLPCASSLTGYDNAGNQLCDTDTAGGDRQYTVDGANRIEAIAMGSSPSSPFATYYYGTDGNRIRKNDATGTNWTEYQWNGNQVLAEKDQAGNWTDYVYAGDKKIAKLTTAEDRIHLHGVICTAPCGNPFASFALPVPSGVTIATGDRLVTSQWSNGARAGDVMKLGTSTFVMANDADGILVLDDTTTAGHWHHRVVPLDSYAGLGLTSLALSVNKNTPGGTWDIYFRDVALVRADGTVIPFYAPGQSITLTPNISATGMSGVTGGVETSTSPMDGSNEDTRYYLDDHLGTAQEELSSFGWPIWYGQFTPYGQELTSEFTNFKYKFTGKERDNESGLDYFGARYYANTINVNISSTMYHLDSGRWMSPDWSDKPEEIPYSVLGDPQSLNLYGYVRNHPINAVDRDGHADVVADCKGQANCTKTVTQTVGIYHYDKKTKTSILDSKLSVTTKFNVNTDAKGNVNVSASSTVANLSGHVFSESQLTTMGKEVGSIQRAGATMGFGQNTTQLLTAMAASETTFGTAKASEPSPFKAPAINPLQLSGGRANGNLNHNIQGALNVFKYFGSMSDYSPLASYYLYSDHRRPTMFNFGSTYTSLSEKEQ